MSTATTSSKYRLSKSKIAAFEHCSKRLWLQVHKRQLGVIDERTQASFVTGHRFGELARDHVPDGTLIDSDPRRVDQALEETTAMLANGWNKPIFEAAFQREDVVVRVDILQPDRWGGWTLIEVKNSAAVRPYQLRDVATQAWVVQANSVCVSSVIIRHPSKRLVDPTAIRLTAPLLDVDVTAKLPTIIRSRARVAESARKMLHGPEPRLATGGHCTFPFRCEFNDFCSGSAAPRE